MSTTINKVSNNEYIQIVRSNGELQKKVWNKEGYCRTNKAYELVNVDDVNDFKYVKSSCLVSIVECY
jgi:hypothetical protein